MYLSHNKTIMNNAKLSHPSANDDECSVFNQTKKNRLLTDENMNDLSLIYDTNHSYKLKLIKLLFEYSRSNSYKG